AEGKLKWALLPYPINAQAQEASMSLEEYEDFVYRSCMVDKENPIEEWRKIGRAQEKTCGLLDRVSQIRIVGEDTDLNLTVKGRKWINSDGKRNMPSGEVFTAPIEDSTDGTIRFTYPGIYAGKEVENITLTFKAGRVVSASAAKGSELLQEIIKIEGADRPGEVAVGINYGINKFTKNMLFDEKMGGTIHMALGNSYPESGGLNRSAIHWDLLKDMKKGGEIYADGKLIYKDGEFLEDFK
ncbi:MAG: aminopeptidase, partial [Candidatus Bathyarchaeota archaeon]|nr:aminopeptidase [Candidatus Bathyarchaeota archaeon]